MYPNISCGQDQKLQLPVPMDRSRWKPNNTEPAPNCPRCASFNPKFCYYNNYSLSQPRYFCKACRRYWTKGGFLRNVPVGGGCRKIRRPKTSRHHLNIYTRSFTGSNSCSTSQEGDDQSAVNKASGSDIDMTLVFAKFLSSGDQDFHNEAANCLTPESVETRTDAPVPFDPITDSCDGAAGVPENFAEQGLMSGIELEWEGLLGGDEVVQDVFSWSDATTSSSSVSWQPPMMQLQDDDEDAQLPISSPTNLFSEGWSWSWSCFDFSNLQVFSSTP